MQYLGFGDFIFRLPDGTEIARASNLRDMEGILSSIPDESVYYHAKHNHFSSWLMARSEIMLASKLKPVKVTDFSNTREIKKYLIDCIHDRRVGRQKGIISEISADNYDPDADFVKVGKGSLGGKARGLAFMSTRLKENPELAKTFHQVDIRVPKTFVISTEGFDSFIGENDLIDLSTGQYDDQKTVAACLAADFPDWLRHHLGVYLKHADYPLAVRSSSLMEDAQFQPFAGIYKTYMLPNNHPHHHQRLEQLILAIKLVYASTYSEASRSFAQSTSHRIEDEKMAVVIQRLTGSIYGDYYYPAISGVAQSYNFYPIAHLQPDDGIAHIALGLGKTVVEGGTTLRFSPRHPQHLPQLSTVDDILKNSQKNFFALKMSSSPNALALKEDATLAKLDIGEVTTHSPIKYLCSTYEPEDHRIRDVVQVSGYCVLTFANILKYHSFPLAEIISELLKIGRTGMGCPVEMEFAVNLFLDGGPTPEFNLLQIRPMAISQHHSEVKISEAEIDKAFCYTTMALGNGRTDDIKDIVYVDPHAFDPARTMDIAAEIGRFNHALFKKNRKYLLIGPGRWGTADPWLGIPVKWKDISGVGAIIETAAQNLKADPSQGSHFFHNITSLGISYFTTSQNEADFIDWKWLQSLPAAKETTHLKHIILTKPLAIKIDGKRSRGIIIP